MNDVYQMRIKGFFVFLFFLLLTACNVNTSGVTSTDSTQPATSSSTPINVDPGVVYTPDNAFDYVNHLRQIAGLTVLNWNNQLATAANNHAYYLTINPFSGHSETLGLNGFTGASVFDRVNAAGYLSRAVGEGLATQTNYQAAIDDLFSAIYHRFTLLDFAFNEIGISTFDMIGNSNQGVIVHDMGNSLRNDLCKGSSFSNIGLYYPNECADPNFRIEATQYDNANKTNEAKNPELVVWPPAGSVDIPPAFFGESPNPLKDYYPNGYKVSGYPVSLQFNPAYVNTVNIKSINLYRDDTGEIISDTLKMSSNTNTLQNGVTDPNQEFTDLEFALFPLQRLDWNTKYRVDIEYAIDGGSLVTKQWTFTTRKLLQNIITLPSGTDTFSIPANTKTAVYIPPLDYNDTIASYAYKNPQNVVVNSSFIDSDTLLISVSGNPGQQVTMQFTSNGVSGIRNIIATIE